MCGAKNNLRQKLAFTFGKFDVRDSHNLPIKKYKDFFLLGKAATKERLARHGRLRFMQPDAPLAIHEARRSSWFANRLRLA